MKTLSVTRRDFVKTLAALAAGVATGIHEDGSLAASNVIESSSAMSSLYLDIISSGSEAIDLFWLPTDKSGTPMVSEDTDYLVHVGTVPANQMSLINNFKLPTRYGRLISSSEDVSSVQVKAVEVVNEFA